MSASLSQKLLMYEVANRADRATRFFQQPAVILTCSGGTAKVLFNRPRFFNCIDHTVINPLAAFLSRCSNNTDITSLVFASINNNNNKTFGTGADLIKGWKIIDQKFKKDVLETNDRLYLINFYRTQHFLHHISRRVSTVSVLDGITMGSSVLFGLNSRYSVATENTIWAAPEVLIGSVPDVGSLFHLKQLPANLGKMLALTGMKVRGEEVVSLGLATHFCHSDYIPDLHSQLEDAENGEVEDILNVFQDRSKYESEKENIKADKIKSISEINFNADDMTEIVTNLQDQNCSTQLAQLAWAAPLSLKTTCRLYTEISSSSYDQALLESYKVAGNIYFCPEMKRGIQAALLGGGKKVPDWKMKTLGEVPDNLVDFCFNNTFKEGILTMEQLRDRNTKNPY